MTDDTPAGMDPRALLADIEYHLDLSFTAIGLAEQEMQAASERHADAAERIAASFLMLRPTHALMRTEVVYLAHCREMLDRIVEGEDLRPGTAAECCLALREVSLRVPLHDSVAGLYLRMWRLAGLPAVTPDDPGVHYEAIAGTRIDDLESWLRHHLRQLWRVMPA